VSIDIQNLGLIAYDPTMKIMADLHAKRCRNECSDTLLVLEHTPVITKGRRLHDQEIPFNPKIHEMGVEIRNADRGGLLTYHGPGQIVVYFVVKFSDYFAGSMDMVKTIEMGLVDFLKDYGIESHTIEEHPGIWVGNKKVCSIGLRVTDGVTSNGIALNVCNDMDIFKLFDPCGMSGDVMVNMQTILGRRIDSKDVNGMGMRLAGRFIERFERK
jgi:lipoyl(octanoyl) transferase